MSGFVNDPYNVLFARSNLGNGNHDRIARVSPIGRLYGGIGTAEQQGNNQC